MENTSLHETYEDVNVSIVDNGSTDEGAGQASPEDTHSGNGSYERIINAQNATIEALTKQIESLNGQITSLVRSTGSQADNTTYNPAIDSDTNGAATIPEDYTYLKELGKEIGRR